MAAEEPTSGGQKQQQQPLPMEGEDITPQKDGGVLKLVKREGSGAETPVAGDKVWVHYVGTLLDGTPFDSSRERGDEKFQFTLGQGRVIKAWELGVATMKVGELCQLVCKPEYAYGSQGSPPKIPPNATLVFEVELFAFHAEDVTEAEDGGVTRRVVAKGQGYDKPNAGAAVEVAVEGSHEGRVFDQREGLKFELGDGESLGLPLGVETAIAAMEQGEESLFTVAPAYGFGSAGSAERGIPGGAELKYKIRLAAFEKAKEGWEMSAAEKLEQSAVVKEKGTQRFREGKYQQAATQYKRVVQWLEPERGSSEEEAPRARELRLAARLNLAACCLKAREPAAALEHCDHALALDEASEKALFRRGEALLALKEYERARADFQKVARLYPANRAAKSQAGLCQERLRAQREKERLLYGRMFHTPSEVEATKPAAGKKSEVEEGKKKEVVGMEVENAGDVQELEKKGLSVEAEEKTA